MKTKINTDEFLTLLYWVKTFLIFEGKPFIYQNLLDQAETYKLKNTPFDTKIHRIDEFVADAYKVYHRIKITSDKVNTILNSMTFIDDDIKNEMFSETKKFETIFEDLIENFRYDDPETRGIQKGSLMEKMNEYVALEDYENAAKMRDMINEC